MMIHLIRHGRTPLDGHFLGRTNPELTVAGWAQTRAQIDRLAWSHVVTSPLKRAQQPALEAAGRGGAVCRIDEDWAEMNFGAWDGEAIEAVRSRAPQAVAAFYENPAANPPPEAETWDAVTVRVARALHAVVAEGRHAPVLVVTHAGAIRAALAVACGFGQSALWSFRIAYASALSLEVGVRDGALWGEIVELTQP